MTATSRLIAPHRAQRAARSRGGGSWVHGRRSGYTVLNQDGAAPPAARRAAPAPRTTRPVALARWANLRHGGIIELVALVYAWQRTTSWSVRNRQQNWGSNHEASLAKPTPGYRYLVRSASEVRDSVGIRPCVRRAFPIASLCHL